ncbi:hypothetical protein [Bacillus sp. OAE603]|uniref:hypothetical protein n=1 Tax=Gottfriedia sp. OAE603 TaxID=2663872 RepID=UPI00178B8476
MKRTLGLHENLELHELINVNSLCLTKLATMSEIAQDLDLQTILLDDAKYGHEHIQRLKEFLSYIGEGEQS